MKGGLDAFEGIRQMIKERDCGVGSSADMPHSVWVVIKELKANPFDNKPAGVFCNKRFAQFWIKNQPEYLRRKYTYFLYESLGNPEVDEQLPEQRQLQTIQTNQRTTTESK